MYRELLEETGLSFNKHTLYLGHVNYERVDLNELHERHFYQFKCEQLNLDLPNTWTHQVLGEGDDKGLIFDYYWLEINEARDKLVAEMGSLLID